MPTCKTREPFYLANPSQSTSSLYKLSDIYPKVSNLGWGPGGFQPLTPFKGGFAHVYLVRTPTPVYNTTHHVLKRIAVANEGMLAEVKKEVDVMVCFE